MDIWNSESYASIVLAHPGSTVTASILYTYPTGLVMRISRKSLPHTKIPLLECFIFQHGTILLLSRDDGQGHVLE